MDLVCPHCQKRLSIEDRHAGAVVKCPNCQGMLKAPTVAATPSAAAPASVTPTPAPPPAAASFDPVIDVGTAVKRNTQVKGGPAGAAVQTPEREFSKTVRWRLRPDVLAWIPPVC